MHQDSTALHLLEPLMKAITLSSSLDDFCRRAVHQILRPLTALGMYIATIETDGNMHIRGQYGIRNSLSVFRKSSNWTSTGIAKCLLEGETIRVDGESPMTLLFGEEHPEAIAVPHKGALFVPFQRYELVIGGLCILLNEPLVAEAEGWIEIEVLSWASELMLSRAHKSNNFLTSTSDQIDRGEISERESKILLMAKEGMTNGQIAKKLHLSESAIKQDLSRIYRKLRVSSRTEALAKYSPPPRQLIKNCTSAE
jgi:DNA-binding CsgD family transcriptional regulator